MKITCNHATSSYGVPVILGDDGDVMDYAPGIKLFREKLNLSTTELGAACNVSRRTVEGWEQGRMPASSAMNLMSSLLESLTK